MSRRGLGARLPALVTAAAIAAGAVLVGASPAAADSLTIQRVDTSKFPTVVVDAVVNGQAPDPRALTVRENGAYVERFSAVAVDRRTLPVGIVLAVDTSGSMRQGAKMTEARAGAKALVAGKQPEDEVAVVGFGQSAILVQPFTTSADALNAAIDRLAPAGETALWDGVSLAVGQLSSRPDLQGDVIVVTDGKDTASKTAREAAVGQARAARVAVFAVGLAGGQDFDSAALQDVARATGGREMETSDPGQLVALYQKVQRSLANQYQITYTSKATGPFDVAVGAGPLTAERRGVSPGQVAKEPVATPPVVTPKVSVGPLRHSGGVWVVVGLVFVAAVLAVGSVATLVARPPSALEVALRPYTEPVDDAEDGSGVPVLAETAVLKRAVAMAEQVARDRGLLVKVERLLERADLKLRAGELLFFTGAAVALLVLLAFVLVSPLAGLLALVLGTLAPIVTLRFLAGRRRKRFVALLPDMLQLLAGTLRAGYSLLQGVAAVVEEIEEPMAGELRRVLVEAQLGRPLETALLDCAERMDSHDFEWAVMAINIQREVGGNLSQLLLTVAETMTQRGRLAREVKALTAEGRMSAIVLGLLPPGLGAAMFVVSPDYIGVLVHDRIGQVMLAGAALWAAFGFWWMKKTITIEI